jgi:hypothetical protein
MTPMDFLPPVALNTPLGVLPALILNDHVTTPVFELKTGLKGVANVLKGPVTAAAPFTEVSVVMPKYVEEFVLTVGVFVLNAVVVYVIEGVPPGLSVALPKSSVKTVVCAHALCVVKAIQKTRAKRNCNLFI